MIRPVHWIVLRLLIVAGFALSIANVKGGESPPNAFEPGLTMFAVFSFVFIAWRVCVNLRRRFRKQGPGDDWKASLWSSPLLRNPVSFWILCGASFVLGALLSIPKVRPNGYYPEMIALELAFGGGILAGCAFFCFLKPTLANQSPKPPLPEGQSG
jgi:hypothetical protein